MKKRICSLALAALFCAAAFAQDYPKGEWFLGYNFVRINSTSSISSYSANGGSSQVAINFSKYVGGVIDLGGYHNGEVNGYSIDNTIFSYLFGPRISVRNHSRATPYFNVLFGGIHASASTAIQPCTGTSCGTPTRVGGSSDAFAMAAGGGLDIKINKHVSFRPIGLDYFLTRLHNPVDTQDHNQNNLRYSAGLNFTFGSHEAPPPPPPPPVSMKTCPDGTSIPASQECPKRNIGVTLSASRTESCPGASITVTPSGNIPDGATFQWTLNGQSISQGRTFDFGTTGRDPGAYRIGLTVAAAGYNDGTSNTSVTVLAYRPPTVSVSASPVQIPAGSTSNITASPSPGQCGGNIRGPVLTASEGSIRGTTFDSGGIQFDPSNTAEQRKSVRITAQVADDRGPVNGETTVTVVKAANPTPTRLPDIVFPLNSSRVNNCGKRVLLEDLKAQISRDPSGKVVFVGHVSDKEKKPADLDQKRALNAAAIISAGSGICSNFSASQIMVNATGTAEGGVDFQPHFCGTSTELAGQAVKEGDAQAKFRRVEVWFVPSGGTMPPSASGSKDAASLSVSSLGCPK